MSANKKTYHHLSPFPMTVTTPPPGSGGPLLKQRGCFSLVFRLTPPTELTESSDAVGRPTNGQWRVTAEGDRGVFCMDAVGSGLRS